LIQVAVDLSGRGYARTNLGITRETIEDLSTEMVPHFFMSFATNARITLHIDRLAGTDSHHCVEGAFKGLARACRSAWTQRTMTERLPSTKGVLV
jgi:imidazoleglycerol-phosphate dehydratase